MGWNNISVINPFTGEFDYNSFQVELNNRLRYALSHIDLASLSIGSTGSLSVYQITASTAVLADISSTNSATFNKLTSSSAIIGQIGSTGSITANTLTASSGRIGQIGSTGLATFNILSSSSATIGQLGSTGSATFNTLASSSATIGQLGSTGSATFNTLASSSATIGQLGSTGSATFNTLASSSAVIGQLGSTGSATFNTLASSSATIGQLGSTGSATFNILSSSSATIGQLGSTGSATFNILSSSSATIGQFGSTGSATFNTLASSSGIFTALKASSASFGNSTSYTMFEDDGTLVCIGDSRTYRDELGDITKLKVAGTAITDDSTDATVNYSTQAALTSYQYVNVQLNHDRVASETLYPHLHWLQSSGNAPNLLLQYRYLPNLSTAESWTYIKCDTLAGTYVSGTLHQISYTTGITPPANSTISDIVQFRIFRDVSNGSALFASTDNHSLPVKLLSFDVHIVTDTLGSRTEFTK